MRRLLLILIACAACASSRAQGQVTGTRLYSLPTVTNGNITGSARFLVDSPVFTPTGAKALTPNELKAFLNVGTTSTLAVGSLSVSTLTVGGSPLSTIATNTASNGYFQFDTPGPGGIAVVAPGTGSGLFSHDVVTGFTIYSSTGGLVGTFSPQNSATHAINYNGRRVAVFSATTFTNGRIVYSDNSGRLLQANVTGTDVEYMSGVTSSVQTQLDGKQAALTATSAITLGGVMSTTIDVSGLARLGTLSVTNGIATGTIAATGLGSFGGLTNTGNIFVSTTSGVVTSFTSPTAAWATLTNGGTISFGPGNYNVPGGFAIPSGATVLLNGANLTATTATNMFTANQVDNWSIIGNGRLIGTGTGSESAVLITSGTTTGYRWTLRDFAIFGYNGSALTFTQAGSPSGMYRNGTVSGLDIRNCVTGFTIPASYEYMRISDCRVMNCSSFAVDCTGGNNDFDNCQFSANAWGVKLNGGNNDTHNFFANCRITHNTSGDVWFNGNQYGSFFTGCYLNNATTTGVLFEGACKGNVFNGGGFNSAITMSGNIGGRNEILNVYLESAATRTISATEAQRAKLHIQGMFTTTGLVNRTSTNSYGNDGVEVGDGGTGTFTTFTTGAIPFARPGDSAYRQDALNLYRDPATGALAARGPVRLNGTSLGGSVGPVVIESGANQNSALQILGKTDTTSPPVDVLSLTPALWVAADRITGKVAGDAVTTWSDLSGNGRDFTKAGSGTISYVADAQNGLPALSFDGNVYMDTANFTLSQPFSVFVVAKKLTANNKVLFNTRTNGNVLLYNFTSTNASFWCGTDLSFSCTPTNWNIYEAIGNGVTSTARSNGATPGTGNAGSNGTSVGYRLCSYGASAGTLNFDGQVSEVLVFGSALSATNYEGVRAYLSNKYAITATGGTAGAGSQSADLLKIGPSSASITTTINSSGKIFSGLDLETTGTSSGVVVKSPNGTRYKIYVNDAGTITTTTSGF